MGSMIRESRVARALVVPVAVLVLWTVVSSVGLVRPAILPAPQDILDALWSIRELVPALCGKVLARAGWGLLLGGLPGIVVGLVFGYSSWARERFLFSVDVLRLIPPLVLLQFLVQLSVVGGGFATRPGLALVTVGVFPIVAIRTVAMFRVSDPTMPLPALARRGLTSRGDRDAVPPDMIARSLDTFRLAVATALGLAVALEVSGLGPLVTSARLDIQSESTVALMTVLVVFASITIGADLALRAVTRAVTGWREQGSGRSGLPTPISEVAESGEVEESAAAPAGQRVGIHSRIMLYRLGLLLAVLIVWVWVAGGRHAYATALPHPWDLVELLTGEGGYGFADEPFVTALLAAAWTTVRGVLLGLLIGTACSVVVVVVLVGSRSARDLLAFSLEIVRPTPLYIGAALAPVWFGLGPASQVGAVAFGALIILTVHLSDAVGLVSEGPTRADVATGASQARERLTTVVPAMLPHLIAGLRLAVAAAWGLSLLPELMVGTLVQLPGLTHLALRAYLHLDWAPGLLITLLYAGMAILSDYVLRTVARRYGTPYTPMGLVGQQLPQS